MAAMPTATSGLKDFSMHPNSPVQIKVSALALFNNVNVVKNYAPDCEILAVVKANAYGHGLLLACEALDSAGISKFGVATLDEALLVRKQQPSARILLLAGANWISDIELVFEHKITPVIGSIFELEKVLEFADRAHIKELFLVHVEIDTGMGRTGITPTDLPAFAKRYQQAAPGLLSIEGVCTHFACADDDDRTYSEGQVAVFAQALEFLQAQKIDFKVIHLANSPGILNGLARGGSDFSKRFANYQYWVRPGLMLYGVSPLKREVPQLEPALDLSAKIVALKWLPADSSVGYGSTFYTQRKSLVAILGIGYAEGVPMSLSGKWHVLINGCKAPIIGRISMNLLAVDVSDVEQKNLKIGDDAILLGASGDFSSRASDWARVKKSIPYIILTSLCGSIPRRSIKSSTIFE